MKINYVQRSSPADMERLFQSLYLDVSKACSRADLAELYSKATYWASLADSPVCQRNRGMSESGRTFDEQGQFQRVARRINLRAKQIGLEAHFAESRRNK